MENQKNNIEENKKLKYPKIGIIFSAFNFLNTDDIKMLEEAKRQCDYLICGLQTDLTFDLIEKNKPKQTVVERYVQLKECKFIDEIVPYITEQDLEDILRSFKIDCLIMDNKFKDIHFIGQSYCEEKGIAVLFINK